MAEEAKEILVKAPEGQTGVRITIPAMGAVDRHTYVADDDGVMHFPLEAKPHADYANGLFRDEDKASATLRERAALIEQGRNRNGKLEEMLGRVLSGQLGAGMPDEAAIQKLIAAGIAAAMPAIVQQARADVMKEMEAATAPPAKGQKN